MAILGKIRDLGPAALISVIGLALFAFVFSTGSGSITDIFDEPNQSPVGSINGEKVSIEEFRNQVDFLERSYNLTGMTAVNNVWDRTLRTLILKNQLTFSIIFVLFCRRFYLSFSGARILFQLSFPEKGE